MTFCETAWWWIGLPGDLLLVQSSAPSVPLRSGTYGFSGLAVADHQRYHMRSADLRVLGQVQQPTRLYLADTDSHPEFSMPNGRAARDRLGALPRPSPKRTFAPFCMAVMHYHRASSRGGHRGSAAAQGPLGFRNVPSINKEPAAVVDQYSPWLSLPLMVSASIRHRPQASAKQAGVQKDDGGNLCLRCPQGATRVAKSSVLGMSYPADPDGLTLMRPPARAGCAARAST